MSVRVLLKRRQKPVFSFSFPAIEAELTPEVVKECVMGRALRRFGLKLGKQMKKKRQQVVGVKLHSVSFTMLYEHDRTP